MASTRRHTGNCDLSGRWLPDLQVAPQSRNGGYLPDVFLVGLKECALEDWARSMSDA